MLSVTWCRIQGSDFRRSLSKRNLKRGEGGSTTAPVRSKMAGITRKLKNRQVQKEQRKTCQVSILLSHTYLESRHLLTASPPPVCVPALPMELRTD